MTLKKNLIVNIGILFLFVLMFTTSAKNKFEGKSCRDFKGLERAQCHASRGEFSNAAKQFSMLDMKDSAEFYNEKAFRKVLEKGRLGLLSYYDAHKIWRYVKKSVENTESYDTLLSYMKIVIIRFKKVKSSDYEYKDYLKNYNVAYTDMLALEKLIEWKGIYPEDFEVNSKLGYATIDGIYCKGECGIMCEDEIDQLIESIRYRRYGKLDKIARYFVAKKLRALCPVEMGKKLDKK